MASRFRFSHHCCAATSPATSPTEARFAPSRLTAALALALALPALAWAQGAAETGTSSASSTPSVPQTITVSGRSASNAASVAGFGDVPLSRAPFSATVITLGQLQDAGISGIGDLTRVDAGTTDA
ncbi:MAG: hypothetical protein ACKOD9_05175, partial [Rubrivivax sp.]